MVTERMEDRMREQRRRRAFVSLSPGNNTGTGGVHQRQRAQALIP